MLLLDAMSKGKFHTLKQKGIYCCTLYSTKRLSEDSSYSEKPVEEIQINGMNLRSEGSPRLKLEKSVTAKIEMGEMEVCPEELRFTVDTIKSSFRPPYHRLPIQDAVERIQKRLLFPNDFTPMNVVQRKGISWCLDNRRLWVFRKARVSLVTVNLVSPDYPPKSLKLFTNLESCVEWNYSRPSYYPRVRGYLKVSPAILHPDNTTAKHGRSQHSQTNNEPPTRALPEDCRDSKTREFAERSMTPAHHHKVTAQLQKDHITQPAGPLAEEYRNTQKMADPVRPTSILYPDNVFTAKLQRDHHANTQDSLNERPYLPRPFLSEECSSTQKRAVAESSVISVPPNNATVKLQRNHVYTHISTEPPGRPLECRVAQKKAVPEGSMTILHTENVTAELSRDPPVAKINFGRPTSFLPLLKDPGDTLKKSAAEGSMTSVHTENADAKVHRYGITGINRERTSLPKPLPEEGTVFIPRSDTANPRDDVKKKVNDLPGAAQPKTDKAAAHLLPKNVPVKPKPPPDHANYHGIRRPDLTRPLLNGHRDGKSNAEGSGNSQNSVTLLEQIIKFCGVGPENI
eukprot:Gb_00494 [translate_table: standard]